MTNPIAAPLTPNVIVDDIASVVKLESTPDGVATVTINRPQRRNALDALTIEGLTEAFETLHGADHVRLVFLRGAGSAFCSGGDFAWTTQALELAEDDNRADAMTLAHMFKRLHDIPAVTVALVHGPAFGGGAGLVAACDYAVATRGARFAFSEVKVGLTPSVIAPYVVDAIGPRAARALFVTGRGFDAEEALRIGLVQEIAADADALETIAGRLVQEVMAAGPEAVVEARRLVAEVWGKSIDHGLMEETARSLAHRRVSDEAREGIAAFQAKRKPSWAKD
ncbi:MAG TPA: enoyl-CoA hydratase-related protein [Caulobacteraceae bacterium]